jgi:hypothetical protein
MTYIICGEKWNVIEFNSFSHVRIINIRVSYLSKGLNAMLTCFQVTHAQDM